MPEVNLRFAGHEHAQVAGIVGKKLDVHETGDRLGRHLHGLGLIIANLEHQCALRVEVGWSVWLSPAFAASPEADATRAVLATR